MPRARRLPGVELPPTLVSLQNAADDLDRLKGKRSKIADEIKGTEGKIIRIMVKHRDKLAKLPNKGILYKMNGYRIECSDKQVLKVKRDG